MLRWSRSIVVLLVTCTCFTAPALAEERWIAPTHQADTGGLGTASNGVWPVTAAGAVRFAWGVPDNLQTFQSARIALIPRSPGGAATLNVYVCAAGSGELVAGACVGPIAHSFTGVPDQLLEVDISAALAPRVGVPGVTNLALLAYTTPTTLTDHFVGLRFGYAAALPAGAATLGANIFSGAQVAPAFVGDGSGLTNLPIPAGAATLGSNTFTGTQTATAFVGDGSGLTNLPAAAGAKVSLVVGKASLTTACGTFCTGFRFRPEGYTPPDQSQFSDAIVGLPTGGATMSDLTFRVSLALPAGHVFQVGFTNGSGTFHYCQITSPSTSCTVPGSAAFGDGEIYGFIDTSYAENRGQRVSFTWKRTLP